PLPRGVLPREGRSAPHLSLRLPRRRAVAPPAPAERQPADLRSQLRGLQALPGREAPRGRHHHPLHGLTTWLLVADTLFSALKVFISVDIEGVAGVVHPSQGTLGSPEYGDACRLMTLECNAAIEGALEAGVQEFVVNDSHAQGRNRSPAELHPAAELVSGSSRLLSMCAGLGPGFDAAFFVGYHSSIGSADSVIDHTYDSRVFSQVRLNERPQSEGSLNATLA